LLERLCRDCLERGYEMILEGDATAWLFHLLLEDPAVDRMRVHCDTRVAGGAEGKRYDLAVGPLASDAPRPRVAAVLALEVKLFPHRGFTDQNHRRHYVQLIGEDLPKLGVVSSSAHVSAAVVVDAAGFLEGLYDSTNRLAYLLAERDRAFPRVHVFAVRRLPLAWRVEHHPPPNS
jgi:hypothetical protein